MDQRLHTENAIPTWAMAVLGAIALSTVLAIGIYRATGHGPASPYELARIVLDVHLEFEDADGGLVLVRDAETGKLLDTLAYGEGGFVRSTLRGLVRSRRQHGFGPETPFHLALRGDGQLTLADPALEQTIYLRAFGPTAEAAFRRFLEARHPDIDSVPLIPRLENPRRTAQQEDAPPPAEQG